MFQPTRPLVRWSSVDIRRAKVYGCSKRDRGGDAEAEVLGDRGHRRDEQQRIVDRDLRRLPERGVGVAAVDVVDAEHVGDEEAVEAARAPAVCARSVQ